MSFLCKIISQNISLMKCKEAKEKDESWNIKCNNIAFHCFPHNLSGNMCDSSDIQQMAVKTLHQQSDILNRFLQPSLNRTCNRVKHHWFKDGGPQTKSEKVWVSFRCSGFPLPVLFLYYLYIIVISTCYRVFFFKCKACYSV